MPLVIRTDGNLHRCDTPSVSVMAVLWLARIFGLGGIREYPTGAEQFVRVELFGPRIRVSIKQDSELAPERLHLFRLKLVHVPPGAIQFQVAVEILQAADGRGISNPE